MLYSLHGYSNVDAGQGLTPTAPQRTSLFEMGLNLMASHFLSYPFHDSCALLEEFFFFFLIDGKSFLCPCGMSEKLADVD